MRKLFPWVLVIMFASLNVNAQKTIKSELGLQKQTSWPIRWVDSTGRDKYIGNLNFGGDTLTIASNSTLRFIKIDDKVYAIKRLTSIEEVHENWGTKADPPKFIPFKQNLYPLVSKK